MADTIVDNWTQDDMVEVTLQEPDDFLKVKETLTRMGIPSADRTKLYQSCHILHKMGKYYIVHFKELFLLDGKPSTLSEMDVKRRNTIIQLLSDWGLVTVVNPEQIEDMAPVRAVKIIPYSQKNEWELVPKYTIGRVKRRS